MFTEKKTPYGYVLVEKEGAPTLAYTPESGVKIIEKDGLPFKDMARTGELLPYEDWRLTPEERADDLARRLSICRQSSCDNKFFIKINILLLQKVQNII